MARLFSQTGVWDSAEPLRRSTATEKRERGDVVVMEV